MVHVVNDSTTLANELRPVLLRLARQVRRESNELGVTAGQVTLLSGIDERPGITARELGDRERISGPGMSAHLERLEAAGLIVRTRGTDRRCVGLTLSAEGERVLRKARRQRTVWLAERLEQLGDDQRAAIEAAIGPLCPARRGRRMTRLVRLAGSRTFASLRRHRNYRLFFAGQITSVCGTWMQNVALAWLILDLTHSPIAVGLLALARFAPFTLLGLFAGVVADRFDNRRTVIVTQSVQMFFSGLLAAVTLLGVVQEWQVYAIATLTGIAVVFDLPARQNLTVQLVGRDELPNAIALNSSLFNTARILGPAVAGIVIATAGAGWCFAINSLSFLAVLAGLLLMRVNELFPLADRVRPKLLAGAREGLSYVRHSRELLVLTLMAAVVMAFAFNVNVLLPVLAKETLTSGPLTFGIITACFGAGALAGSLVAATLGKARWAVMLGSVACSGSPRSRSRRCRTSSSSARCSSSAASASRPTPPRPTRPCSSARPTTSAAGCSASTSTPGRRRCRSRAR